MDERNVYATWRGMCEKNEDVLQVYIIYLLTWVCANFHHDIL